MKKMQRPSICYVNRQKMFCRNFYYTILFILTLCCVNGYSISKYPEAEKYGQNCPELDSCKHERYAGSNPRITRNCACDDDCNKYNDCCIDAPRINAAKSNEECHDVTGLGGVYMIGFCPQGYDNEDGWRELCEGAGIADPSDPIGTMPVTDYDTGLTYKNVYCKWCNNEQLHLTHFWNPKLECPLLSLFNESGTITDEYVIRNLTSFNGIWGVNVEQEDGENFFLDCFITPIIPRELQHKVRRCNRQLIGDCPSTWKDEKTRQKCNSYLGPRFTEDGTAYRNVHCAVCNDVNVFGLSCHSPIFENLDIFRYTGTHSFALLLDVSLKKGGKVGMIKLCGTAEVYDPFFKKCRRLECIPGFIRQGLKCFPRKPVRRIIIRRPVLFRRISSTTSKPSTEAGSVHSSTTVFASTRSNTSYSSQKTSYEIRPSTSTSSTREKIFETTEEGTISDYPELTTAHDLTTETVDYETLFS